MTDSQDERNKQNSAGKKQPEQAPVDKLAARFKRNPKLLKKLRERIRRMQKDDPNMYPLF